MVICSDKNRMPRTVIRGFYLFPKQYGLSEKNLSSLFPEQLKCIFIQFRKG